eukprot:1352552-Prymnesium_polylepis.2
MFLPTSSLCNYTILWRARLMRIENVPEISPGHAADNGGGCAAPALGARSTLCRDARARALIPTRPLLLSAGAARPRCPPAPCRQQQRP